ncbi:Long-chain-fatty-acid--CoA ligase (plasmid) [Pseudonocardia dioxanivorans CB1190]|uniref:Long-chain-fatty-acid--CoA ligase n=1 Tax=Pseudonocardia dioxanivorans (strain ATCC 55486 / DSM 44775 / JCM 13855 / CB1190) TaxID=675635 RepID=F2L6G2_PSEUX|nr:AMP-binding protein [Pseudonocardia dioxanivorans]AEA28856.1 Long-chain-fatty-acid--CoA ligase [Pseudonocardia dioxanivorans CB1190]
MTTVRVEDVTGPVPEYWEPVDLSSRELIDEYERTPLAARGLPSSVYDYIRDGARIAPQRTALLYVPDAHDPDSAVHVSHAELLRKITQAANLFGDLGVTGDDPVSILTAGAPEPQVAFWGAQAAGIANPLNWMLDPDMLGVLISTVGSRVLVAFGGDDVTDPWPKIDAILDHAPCVDTVIRAGGARTGHAPRGVRFLQLEDELERYDGETVGGPREIGWNTVGGIFATGGTTGAPKLAKVTHGGQIYASWGSAISHQVPVGVVRFGGSPMFHVHGLAITQLTALALGGTAVLPTSGGWRGPGVVDEFWNLAQRFAVDSVPLLPTIANRLVQRPEAIPAHHPIERVTSGSALLSAEIANRFRQLTGLAIREGYGLTETSGAVVSSPRGMVTVTGAVGMPIPYTQARVVRTDEDGKLVACAPGESGVLHLRGPAVFAGYVDPAQDDGALLEDGWLDTGDLFSVEENGFLRITGRLKDVIIRGGHNIDPAAGEEALFAHPRVTDAAVVGMPDTDAGEVPVAYVVPARGANLGLPELAEHTRHRVRERAALPREYIVVDELPRSPIGKVAKNRLRLDATSRVFTRLLDGAALVGRYELTAEDHGAAGIVVDVRLLDYDHCSAERARAALAALTVQHRIH